MTINEIQDEVIEEFIELDDWMDRYQLLIDLGEEQEPLDEAFKTNDNLIDGCQSRVWLVCENQNGILHFKAESDALIVKGIVNLLLRIVNNQPAKDILEADFYFIEQIGLTEHLSPTRSNGLLTMIRKIKVYALAMSASQN
jgi:cysteine desulfuration protein SufE